MPMNTIKHAQAGRAASRGLAPRRLLNRLTPRPARRSRQHTLFVPRAAAPQVLGAAAKLGAWVPNLVSSAASSVASSIDVGVLSATLNASAKLAIICAAVGWLLRSGRIPNSTATVLSKVSYEIMIPAMLFSKVAQTLAAQPDASLLLGIAAIALLQICIGAACGLGLTAALGLRCETQQQQQQQQRQQQRDAGGGGWQARGSSAAASAIALSMAAASGAPAAALALKPKQAPPVAGPAQLVPAAAAFGNSFTLPAVFLTTLLPKALADRALGYAALFLLAWSPCLWSIGLALVRGKQGPKAQQGQKAQQAPQQVVSGRQTAGTAADEQQQASEPPPPKRLAWRQPRVVDVTPLTAPGSSGGNSSSSSSSSSSDTSAAKEEAASQSEPLGWTQRLALHPFFTSQLGQFGTQVMNPPVLAILLGMLVGLTPAGRAVMAISQPAGAAAAGTATAGAALALPPELGMVHALAKATLEVIELLAQGTLAVQTLVLASSLLQQPAGRVAAINVGPASAATAAAAASRHRRGWLGALKQLLPSDSVEARSLAILSFTRFLLLPLATLGCLQALASGGLLSPVMSDPVLLFVLLTEACMPSAQNLIILLQLSESTQALAPSFARMLLKLYIYAILPVTLWVTAFATNLGIPVLR
ncbi:hypothetical protein ACK3TF_003943 [Chlorella vulgaris]